MPFRLDDVLHMDWAREHSFWDAFDPIKGEIVRSYRPIFAATIWILTHTAGTEHYFPWHVTLVSSFVIGLAFTGLTARYISKQDSVLYFTTALYWIVALPILNVLFWFGDLTFTIELMFTAASWYYGIRGMYEGKLFYWFFGCLLGAAAIASKEPAILMVHAVLVGIFLLDIHKILSSWKQVAPSKKILAVIFYLLLCAVTLHIFFGSNTRSNRFFIVDNFTTEEMNFFINDRFRYYGEVLLTPLSRIIIIFPLVTLLLRSVSTLMKIRTSSVHTVIIVLAAAAITSYFSGSLLILSGLLITSPIFYTIASKDKKFLLLLPFSLCVIVTFAALMLTVMLVKTQLTEVTMLVMLISGIAWGVIWHDVVLLFKKLPPSVKRISPYVIGLCFAGCMYVTYPMFSNKEKLLNDVQAVRLNANNSIKWMAKNLPHGSTVLVSGHSLYGNTTANELTSKTDEEKLYSQYTFLQGYIRSYFYNLGRFDLRVAYLEDSVLLNKVLTSFRGSTNAYLFLQIELDNERFYSQINGMKPILDVDSVLIRFEKNGFSSEVVKLGNN